MAQSIRLALIAANVDFVDVRIEAGTADSPEGKNAWLAMKHTDDMISTLSFPNLPYFLHPDLPSGRGLVQSDCILRFIGTKYGMMGVDAALTDMHLEHLADLEGDIARNSYGHGSDAVLQWYQTCAARFLKQYGRLLTSSCQFLSEQDQPSVADWKLYVFLYKLTVVQKQLGSDMTASIIQEDWIQPYMQRLEGISTMKSYMASDSYMKGFLNNPSAKWRG